MQQQAAHTVGNVVSHGQNRYLAPGRSWVHTFDNMAGQVMQLCKAGRLIKQYHDVAKAPLKASTVHCTPIATVEHNTCTSHL
jgi:hypothetical protein